MLLEDTLLTMVPLVPRNEHGELNDAEFPEPKVVSWYPHLTLSMSNTQALLCSAVLFQEMTPFDLEGQTDDGQLVILTVKCSDELLIAKLVIWLGRATGYLHCQACTSNKCKSTRWLKGLAGLDEGDIEMAEMWLSEQRPTLLSAMSRMNETEDA